jgi:hypothetical protein
MPYYGDGGGGGGIVVVVLMNSDVRMGCACVEWECGHERVHVCVRGSTYVCVCMCECVCTCVYLQEGLSHGQHAVELGRGEGAVQEEAAHHVRHALCRVGGGSASGNPRVWVGTCRAPAWVCVYIGRACLCVDVVALVGVSLWVSGVGECVGFTFRSSMGSSMSS